ncbi:hypothetical protein BCR33DRAFT_793102 [Rhizoclosmatium globosum]|uniref:N-acetyltransferase domain-containing protein n=1 Tax=Rhizoclosmatium globosum TaxID=329046 RepID=A0A1Y2B375_9FUNG|nr:hypothetical protein BCR33DRAFT_793102 [Rhizoclosmatium globosum]|eukprot:ORY29273.1 hypothetical protein BCR33DRAFT_793102 [Rhizoclosmatium globosum]
MLTISPTSDAEFITSLSRRIQDWLIQRNSLQQIVLSSVETNGYIVQNHAFVFTHSSLGSIGSVFLEPLPKHLVETWKLVHIDKQTLFLSKLMLEPSLIGSSSKPDTPSFGSQMIQCILNANAGIPIVLDCWDGNTSLRRFYERHGFKLHGIFEETDQKSNESWNIAVYVHENRG